MAHLLLTCGRPCANAARAPIGNYPRLPVAASGSEADLASAQSQDPWRQTMASGFAAFKTYRYLTAEALFREALQTAGGMRRREALSLRALVLLYATQGKLLEARDAVKRLVGVFQNGSEPEDADVVESYRETARLVRTVGLSSEAADLEALATRLASGTAAPCRERAVDLNPRALANSDRANAIKVIESLRGLAEWTAGADGKNKADYAARLGRVEGLASEYLGHVPDGPDAPRASIRDAIACFQEALRAWPRVAEPWTMAASKVGAAERILDLRPKLPRRVDTVDANSPRDERPQPPQAVAARADRTAQQAAFRGEVFAYLSRDGGLGLFTPCHAEEVGVRSWVIVLCVPIPSQVPPDRRSIMGPGVGLQAIYVLKDLGTQYGGYTFKVFVATSPSTSLALGYAFWNASGDPIYYEQRAYR